MEIGILGLINGIVGTQAGSSCGYVAACFEEGEEIPGGHRISHFKVLDQPLKKPAPEQPAPQPEEHA